MDESAKARAWKGTLDDVRFLKSMMLRGLSYELAVENLKKLEDWTAERHKALYLLEKSHAPYSLPYYAWIWSKGLDVADRSRARDLHYQLWAHERKAATSSLWSCECDMCKSWTVELEKLNARAREKVNKDKRRTRANRRRNGH